MEIRFLTQDDTQIVEVERIEEVKLEDGSFQLKGINKSGDVIELGHYKEAHHSNIVMLHIVKNYNGNPSKIIRLPKDDAEIEELDY